MSGATRGGWIHGKTVVDGEVQYLSVSSLQKAELCLRRWFYHYALGIKEDDTDATRRGVIKHKETANFLITGSRAGLSSQVLSGMFMIPEPGPDLDVEFDVLTRPDIEQAFTAANSRQLLLNAPLRAAGIALTGAIDLKHRRGTNKGTTDITQAKDPPGTVEVLDWKFPGNMNNAKAPHELIHTIQMAGYGKYVFETIPDAKLVRLSHGYMPVKGRPAKVSALHDREEIERAWESVDVLAGSIRDAAKELNPDLIDANTRSCRAFGKDCPAKSVCKAAGHDSLSEIVGFVAARDELEIAPGEPQNMPSLGEQIRAKQAAATQTPAAGKLSGLKKTTSSEPKPDVKAEMLKIARDEANAKHPGLMQLLTDIAALGVGMPILTGDLAKAKGVLSEPPVENKSDLPGEGELGEYSCASVDELQMLLSEATALLGEAPETPVETPAPDTTSDAATEIAAAAAEPTKKKRGSKKKDQGGVASDAAAEKMPTGAGETSSGSTTSAPVEVVLSSTVNIEKSGAVESAEPASASSFYFYVDCIPSVPYKSFWPIAFDAMNYLAAKLSEEEKKTIPDPRLGDPNGKAGFGKWKPLVATYLKHNEIPTSGHWVLDGAHGEMAQEVVIAMREICFQNGGVFIRGTR